MKELALHIMLGVIPVIPQVLVATTRRVSKAVKAVVNDYHASEPMDFEEAARDAGSDDAAVGMLAVEACVRDAGNVVEILTALCRHGCLRAAEAVIEHNPRVCSNPAADQVFAAAAARGGVTMMQMLRKHRIPVNGDAIRLAAQGGHMAAVQWLSVEMKCPVDARLIAAAAEGGRVPLLRWLRARGCPWDERACTAAAVGGQFAALKWLHMRGCPWSCGACKEAAAGGHLEMLQWLRERDCPWNVDSCDAAAVNGHLAVLHWAYFNGGLFSESIAYLTAGAGKVEVVQWLREVGCIWDWYHMMSHAVAAGHLEMLQWLVRQGGNHMDEYTMALAIQRGHLAVIRWMDTMGIEWDPMVASIYAAYGGHLDLLKWVRTAKGVRLYENHMRLATGSGMTHVMQWLHAQGLALTESIFNRAASVGNIRSMEWLLERGCPWSECTFMVAAGVPDNVPALQWLHSKKCPWGPAACDSAAIGDCLEGLRFLLQAGCPAEIDRCMYLSVFRGRLRALEYLCKNFREFNSEFMCWCAVMSGRRDSLHVLLNVKCPIDTRGCMTASAEIGDGL
jgi:hypothetical protein